MQFSLLAFVLACVSVFPASISAQNVSAIAESTREGWCTTQIGQCPALCLDKDQGTRTNECFPKNLYYQCVCDDGTTPNLTQYSQTIPYYLCTIAQGECIKACGSNNDCSESCKRTHKCGASSPIHRNATATSTLSTASPTSTGDKSNTDSNGFATTGGPDSNSNSAAGALFLEAGQAYGMGIVAAGIAAGVAFIGL